jgi:predicted NBD/HSP70 family sugar kinase
MGRDVVSAIVVEGELYRGAHNSAGELGHITLDRDGDLCSCGCRACVETFVSGPWLARRYLRRLQESGDPAPVERVTSELVASLAREGDAVAKQILTEGGEALGVAIATAAMILDEAQEWLECLWCNFNEVVLLRSSASARYFAGFPIGFNVLVGGQLSDGGDATNVVSHMCLRAQAVLGLTQPDLSCVIDDCVERGLDVTAGGERVAGYSAYFRELDRELQDEVIRRTEYAEVR